VKSKGIEILCGVAVLSLAVVVVAPAGAAPTPQEQAAPAPAGLLTGPATVPRHWSKNPYPESIPEGESYYLVVRGDTLWDISKRFLGNPYLWPQIWDYNKYIRDAHWIYPGDPILFPKLALIGARAGEPGLGPGEEGLPGEGPGALPPGAVLYPVSEEFTMQCAHYIISDPEDESLFVIGSEDGATKVAFTERDILYLNKGSNAGVRPGDVYTLHHRAYPVKHPENGKKIGTKVETTGWARVILVQENSSTSVVEAACNDIHAGDYAKPLEKPNVPLALRRAPADRTTPPTGKAHGWVVDISDDSSIAGAGHLVSIDLGADSGVTPGNILAVYRIMYPSVPTSRNVLGELAILAVRERTATAKVTYSRDAIMVGDEVELR
jgi:hypothetical protein